MWAAGLFGLTPKQIARGVRACMLGTATTDGWPPTLPQFRELCLQLPSISEVRAELLSRDGKRSSFGLLVSQKLDVYRWRQAEEQTGERMLKEAYLEAKKHALSGGEMPQVFEALPDDSDRERPPASPEVVAATLAQIREML